MMERQNRAKQFIPFDAMKGLKEALAKKEEKHSRVKLHEIPEEQQIINSKIIINLKKGQNVKIDCFKDFHNIIFKGKVTEINLTFKYLALDNEKIRFEEIYSIEVI